MTEQGGTKFYRVCDNLRKAPTESYHAYGYESEHDFYLSLRRLRERWHNRVGEVIDERHGFLRLKFCDVPDGSFEAAWLPRFLLEPTSATLFGNDEDSCEEELDQAFGFD